VTLHEAFQVMLEAGYRQAIDAYSRFPRPIREWMEEARSDLTDCTPHPETGEITQNVASPSNRFICTRSL